VTLALALSPEAEDDLHDAAAWYDAQQPGLGDVFLRSVDACFARIRRFSRGFRVDADGIRSALLRRFPYVVLFRIRDTRSEVRCVARPSRPGGMEGAGHSLAAVACRRRPQPGSAVYTVLSGQFDQLP